MKIMLLTAALLALAGCGTPAAKVDDFAGNTGANTLADDEVIEVQDETIVSDNADNMAVDTD